MLKNTLPLSTFLLAAQNGNLQVIKALLVEENGVANLYSPGFDERRSYAIHMAAENGHLGVVQYLVERWPNIVDLLDKNEETCMYRSVKGRHLKVAKFLVKSPFCPQPKLEARNFQGKTILHVASESGSLPVVKLLISVGAEIDAINCQDDARNAAHYACEHGHLAVLKYLLKIAPQLALRRTLFNIDSLLHVACEFGRENCARYLIRKWADAKEINSVGSQYACTPVFLAAGHCSLKLVKYVVRRFGPSILLQPSVLGGYSCLHFATFHHKRDVMVYLMEKTPSLLNVKAKRHDGVLETPLEMAEELAFLAEVDLIKFKLSKIQEQSVSKKE